jgi:hypothetical protein
LRIKNPSSVELEGFLSLGRQQASAVNSNHHEPEFTSLTTVLSWIRQHEFNRDPANNSKRKRRLDCPSNLTGGSMSELHHHPERATHHRSLDVLMEVQFVLEHTERSVGRLRALGQEPEFNTLELRSDLEQLQRGIRGLSAGQALERAEAIRARAQALFVVLQA